MRMTYDPAVDAACVYFTDSACAGQSAKQIVTAIDHGTVVLDMTASGTLIGVEVLGAQNVLPTEALERTRQQPYVVLAVYESTSSAPDYKQLFEEVFIIIFAESAEAAQVTAQAEANAQEARYCNDHGDTITWTLKHIVDVAPAIDGRVDAGGTLYTRHFRNFDAYGHMEPLFEGDPL